MSDSVTPWTAGCQVSLSFTISRNLLMSFESVMLSNHLILCSRLFLLPSIIPSIRVFSNELALRIRWPKAYLLPCELEICRRLSQTEYVGLKPPISSKPFTSQAQLWGECSTRNYTQEKNNLEATDPHGAVKGLFPLFHRNTMIVNSVLFQFLEQMLKWDYT